ncbi:MAG: hypothetical protein K5650_03375 [Bacteroidales bacterium]|nr:hypothetical protein [Bacteroidales bacterium]
MTKLLIFNPEHDLCLAHANRHYVAPRSAVEYARSSCAVMLPLCPDAVCTSAYDPLPTVDTPTVIVPWGWNITLKQQLLQLGADPSLLPDDDTLHRLRQLQHRSTLLPLQPDCMAATSIQEVEAALADGHGQAVLKAPWSGAGRGLRFVGGNLSPLDRTWIDKTLCNQQCVMVEPRRDVVLDFALEYLCSDGQLHFIGFSAFNTANGVYRNNLELTDMQIEQLVLSLTAPHALDNLRAEAEPWLESNIAAHYSGPLGLDLMACRNGTIAVAEHNMRYTMGMVAHAKINRL